MKVKQFQRNTGDKNKGSEEMRSKAMRSERENMNNRRQIEKKTHRAKQHNGKSIDAIRRDCFRLVLVVIYTLLWKEAGLVTCFVGLSVIGDG